MKKENLLDMLKGIADDEGGKSSSASELSKLYDLLDTMREMIFGDELVTKKVTLSGKDLVDASIYSKVKLTMSDEYADDFCKMFDIDEDILIGKMQYVMSLEDDERIDLMKKLIKNRETIEIEIKMIKSPDDNAGDTSIHAEGKSDDKSSNNEESSCTLDSWKMTEIVNKAYYTVVPDIQSVEERDLFRSINKNLDTMMYSDNYSPRDIMKYVQHNVMNSTDTIQRFGKIILESCAECCVDCMCEDSEDDLLDATDYHLIEKIQDIMEIDLHDNGSDVDISGRVANLMILELVHVMVAAESGEHTHALSAIMDAAKRLRALLNDEDNAVMPTIIGIARHVNTEEKENLYFNILSDIIKEYK